MDIRTWAASGLTALLWPQGGGRERYPVSASADRIHALCRSLSQKGFAAIADAWRTTDHREIVGAWRDDCGKWNLWTNGHQSLYDTFVHEPTARLIDGLDMSLRRAHALGLEAMIEKADAEVFVAAWSQVAAYRIVEPAEFGRLLADPPQPWAAGLVVGSLLIAAGDPLPVAFEPLMVAVDRAAAN